jgi:copper chaperone
VATKIYTVTGMTCAHCVNAVSKEVAEISGVQAVDVHLDSGRVTVTGDGFTDEQVASAIDEAGYALAAAQPPLR